MPRLRPWRKLSAVLARKSNEALYHDLMSHWQVPEDVVIGSTTRSSVLSDPTQWAAVEGLPQWMMYVDLVSYLPDDILVKVDRASMAVSLESRAPFLDHSVVEFAWSLPVSMKIANGVGKRLLRRLLDRYVPRELVERPKKGFGVPLERWLRGSLKEWASDLLAPERLRREGFLDAPTVTRTWEEHQSGARNWHYQLWNVLMFQAWLTGQ